MPTVGIAEFRPYAVTRCPACGLIVGTSAARDTEGAYADGRYVAQRGAVLQAGAQRKKDARRRLAWISEWAPRGRILEAGPGGGFFLAAAQAAGYSPIGVEPDEPLAARLRARGLEVYACRIEDFDLPGPHVDAACAFHVLEHTLDPVSMLRALARFVKPSGLLFIEVPNIEAVSARRQRGRWSHFDPSFHAVHFTQRALAQALDRGGWRVVESHTILQSSYLLGRTKLRPRVLAGRLYRAAALRSLRTLQAKGGDFLRVVGRRR